MSWSVQSFGCAVRWRLAVGFALVALLGLLVVAGGGEGTSPTTATTATNSTTSTTPASPSPQSEPDKASQHSGGAAEFETPGGDNSIPRFGNEATDRELAEAADVLHNYIQARIDGDWQRICSDLARSTQDAIRNSPGFQDADEKSCAELIGAVFTAIPPDSEAAVAHVVALRAKGARGYLLFHGAHDTDYVISMRREHGQWKLGAPAPSLLP